MFRCQTFTMSALTALTLIGFPALASAQSRGGFPSNSGGFGGSSFGGGGGGMGNSFGNSSFGGGSFGGGSFGGSGFGSNGFSGGFGGSSFSGGFSGGSFGGSSFSGNSFSGNSGSSFLGSSTGIGSRLPGANSSSSDPFASTRANPLAMGQAGGNSGSYYGNMQGNANQLGGMFGNNRFGNSYGGNYGSNMGSNMSGMNGNTTATTRQPAYVLRPGFTAPVAPTSDVTARVQKALAAAPSLPTGSKINLSMDGNTVVLRGEVASESEKRVAEAMARLEPGVYEVRNEIRVGSSAETKK